MKTILFASLIVAMILPFSNMDNAFAQTISTEKCVDISTGVDDIGNPLNHGDDELHWSLFINGTESTPIVVNKLHTQWFDPDLLNAMWISPTINSYDPAINYTYSIDFNTPNTLSGHWQMKGSISADNSANSFMLDGQPITLITSGPISWSTHRTFTFDIPVDTSLTMHTLTMDVPNFRPGNTDNPTGLLVDAQVCIIPLPQVDEEVITKDLHFGSSVEEYTAIKTPQQQTYLKQISCHIEDPGKSKRGASMKVYAIDSDGEVIEETKVYCEGKSATSEFIEPMVYLPPNTEILVSTSSGGYYAVDVWLQIKVNQSLGIFSTPETVKDNIPTGGKIITSNEPPILPKDPKIEKKDIIIKKKTVDEITPIPTWIKTNAEWWSKGLISDNDYKQGIEWMANADLIQVFPR